MKNLKKLIFKFIIGIFVFTSFLIPRTTAQEWTYDGVDTTNIPGFSVYPSEWYVYNASFTRHDPHEILNALEIVKGNISWLPAMSGNGTCVWGNGWQLNTTSGEKTLIIHDMFFGFWNESIGFSSGDTYIIPVENNGKVSIPILNNISAFIESVFPPNYFDHSQVYPNINSFAYWNTSNNAYCKLNFTDRGILYQLETYKAHMWNVTLYSQPAQFPPDFSFTTESGILDVNSTSFKLNITITDADNNNDGSIDTNYLFRILNGSAWSTWASPPNILDWDLGLVPAGNYSITIEVKNMYGVTQEQLTIQYTPSETTSINGFPIYLVVIVAMLGVLVIITIYPKKLR